MANWDHADNIGTHPAFSQDEETRLRARLDAADRNLTRAEQAYTAAQAALAEFTLRRDGEATTAWLGTPEVGKHRAEVAA